MTDFIKAWLTGVCMTSIFSAVIFALASNDNIKKSLKLACGVTVIAAIFLPFANGSIDLKLNDLTDSYESQELQSDSFYKLTAILSDEVTEKLDSVLTKNGYPDCEINILTGQNENGLVIVKRADIKVPDKKSVDEATKDKLYELLGENVIIIFS